MSQVDELLENMSGEEIAAYSATPETEPHIVVGPDRKVTVPDILKRLGVQHDHNIETVTFDCPKMWDGRDLSQMKIYINYLTANSRPGSYYVGTPTIDETDPSIMHFDWTISGHVTQAEGNIVFLVCAKNTNTDGEEIAHWNSEICSTCFINEGLEVDEQIQERYPDIITQLLTRMDEVKAETVDIMKSVVGALNILNFSDLVAAGYDTENPVTFDTENKTITLDRGFYDSTGTLRDICPALVEGNKYKISYSCDAPYHSMRFGGVGSWFSDVGTFTATAAVLNRPLCFFAYYDEEQLYPAEGAVVSDIAIMGLAGGGGGSGLPAVTAADDGKVLTASGGAWVPAMPEAGGSGEEEFEGRIAALEDDMYALSHSFENVSAATQGKTHTFQLNTDKAYIKVVPDGALPYARIQKLGGSSDALGHDALTAVVSHGANLLPYPYPAAESVALGGLVVSTRSDGGLLVSGYAYEDIYYPLYTPDDGLALPAGDVYVEPSPYSGVQLYVETADTPDSAQNGVVTIQESDGLHGRYYVYLKFLEGTNFTSAIVYPAITRGAVPRPGVRYRDPIRYEIPEEIRALNGYGYGVNYLDFVNGWYYLRAGDGGTLLPAIEYLPLPKDFLDECWLPDEAGGALVFENADGNPIRSEILFGVKL